ncbi:MAG: terminase small subunit [Mucispirillum schaedleri]|nr:terminase small subunit [Mucispirillum schaedleri]
MSNKNSNYPTNAQPNATPAEIGELVGVMDGLRKLPPVPKREPEKVEERLNYYFQYCTDKGIKPSVEGMSLCLGVSRQSLWEWENDTGSKSGQLVARAKELINSLLTTWTMNGKINAVYTIWLQKNNSGYSDTKTLEIKPQTEPHHISLEEQIEESGLVWDEQLEEYVPADS